MKNLCSKRSIFQLIATSFTATLLIGSPYAFAATVDTCGYDVTTNIITNTGNGYRSSVTISNVSGDSASRFELLLDVGKTRIRHAQGVRYSRSKGGYKVKSLPSLELTKINPGESFIFEFKGVGQYQAVTPYTIAINDEVCDKIPPVVSLNSNQKLFTSDNTLTLDAITTDNIAVRKVDFHLNGEVIGVKREAPFSLDFEIENHLNGRQNFTATAYDPTGNKITSTPQSVLVAIGNRFLGTAPSGEADYADLNTYFNQLTPENASKWGAAEPIRDEMNWADLDTAFAFAQNNNVVFKFHTLIWGQQAPEWITDLPLAEQLEEIEEWMALVAERYPDIELIDVVNEPLHAPPAYMEALGGSGDTGWDWVIKSFELARQYFPKSELILNDYQILILENFTSYY